MNDAVQIAWNPRELWEVHRAISFCSKSTRPTIKAFHGVDISDRPCTKWAVFPSSYNPPTKAHVEILLQTCETAGYERVLLVLDTDHADKPELDALLEDRALMMKIQFTQDPRLTLGVCSHGRFWDKLHALDAATDRMRGWTFVVGMDTLARILDPRFYSQPQKELNALFERARFVVFTRPGVVELTEVGLEAWVRKRAPLTRLSLPLELQTISSSEVRKRRAKGRPIHSCVSPDIERFIEETGLYSPTPPNPPLYQTRKRLLQRLFRQGLRELEKWDLRIKTLEACQNIHT